FYRNKILFKFFFYFININMLFFLFIKSNFLKIFFLLILGFYTIPYKDLDFTNCKLLGRGYFGEVNKVKWKGMDVACKIIYRKSFQNKTDIDMYLREVGILR